jgi:hypothetical protein
MAASRQSLYAKGINSKEVMFMDVVEVERVRKKFGNKDALVEGSELQ